jgi:hypothetical protein
VRPAPVDVYFLPEKKRIGAVVRKVQRTQRAYPLMGLASLFLGSPDSYLVKLEVSRDADPQMQLYQCKECRAVFLSQEELTGHCLSEHLDLFYEKVDLEVDPPSGNFVCIGRCSMSGMLIGPPNYHGFNERVRELHETKFSHMPLDEYRRRIEMVHEEELIEQWKNEARRQVRYRIKSGEEDHPLVEWHEVEADFRRNHERQMTKRGRRVILPARVVLGLPVGGVRRAVREAWTREERHPFTLSLALRPAFRHMRLYLFKGGRGGTFVTAIHPRPVEPEETISTIGEVLAFLAEHPGCTRKQLVEGLRPGAEPESEQVAEVVNPLRWLVERGHVIEFFDGTLSVPGHAPRRGGKKKRGGGKKGRD